MTHKEEYEKIGQEIHNLYERQRVLYELIMSEETEKKEKFRLIIDKGDHSDYMPTTRGKILDYICYNSSKGATIELYDHTYDAYFNESFGTFEQTKDIYEYFGVEIDETDFEENFRPSKYTAEDMYEFFDNIIEFGYSSFAIYW